MPRDVNWHRSHTLAENLSPYTCGLFSARQKSHGNNITTDAIVRTAHFVIIMTFLGYSMCNIFLGESDLINVYCTPVQLVLQGDVSPALKLVFLHHS